MMCVAHGKFTINDILIEETTEKNLSADDVLYKQYINDSFDAGAIKDDIKNTFNDDDYHMRVKTLAEVSNLELRGTPLNNKFTMRFENKIIKFYKHANGDDPDLTSLISGSLITISSTNSNNGTYIVESIVGLNVTVSSKKDDGSWTSFTLEPTDTYKQPMQWLSNSVYYIEDGNALYLSIKDGSLYPINYALGVADYSVFKIRGYTGNAGVEFYSMGRMSYEGFVLNAKGYATQIRPLANKYIHQVTSHNQYNYYDYVAKSYTAIFETSYGAYHLEDEPTELKNIEIDIEYPRGIYNSNSSGVFTDRNIELQYNLIGNVESGWINLKGSGTVTETEKTNTPQRRSYLLNIPANIDNSEPLKIRLKRVSPETDDIKSQDMAVITRIKAIYKEPDITAYGDITILWAKIKATNAISSKGQFKLNAWVERTDVANDMKSVLTDIYSNTNYGAKLDALDLFIPDDTGAVVNGAIDGKLSVLETMQMVAKANRYQLYLNGAYIYAKKDTIRPIRTMAYSETNIIKGSWIFKMM